MSVGISMKHKYSSLSFLCIAVSISSVLCFFYDTLAICINRAFLKWKKGRTLYMKNPFIWTLCVSSIDRNRIDRRRAWEWNCRAKKSTFHGQVTLWDACSLQRFNQSRVDGKSWVRWFERWRKIPPPPNVPSRANIGSGKKWVLSSRVSGEKVKISKMTRNRRNLSHFLSLFSPHNDRIIREEVINASKAR